MRSPAHVAAKRPFGFHCLQAAALTACLLAMAGCTGKGADTKAAGKKGDMAVPVTVAKVVQKDVPIEIQVIGNVEAYSTVMVRAQTGGELVKVHFREGDYVNAGAPMFNIDPRLLDAQVSQAEASHEKAKALLGQAEANLARDTAQAQYLKSQADRIAGLVAQGVVSKDQGEQTRAAADAALEALKADRATIASAKAEIASTKATLDNLRVQFSYTEIRAPLAGRTGNILVKQGNIVTANNMDLVTINQVQPIYVTFPVPESQMASIKQYMAMGRIPVTATPQDNSSATESGVLVFTDNAVDATTGTIKMKAVFQNPGRTLWPGQFVRVTLKLTTAKDAIVVPNQAVQSGQEGPFVFVVKENRTVEARPVVTGARVDQELVIGKGLTAGETVVTEGQLRLAPGTRVVLREGRGGPGGGPGRGRPRQ